MAGGNMLGNHTDDGDFDDDDYDNDHDDYDNVCGMRRAGPWGPEALTELPDQCQTRPSTLATHYKHCSRYQSISIVIRVPNCKIYKVGLKDKWHCNEMALLLKVVICKQAT